MTQKLLKGYPIIMLVSQGYLINAGYIVMSKNQIKHMQIPIKYRLA